MAKRRSTRSSKSTVKTLSNKAASSAASKAGSPKFKGIGASAVQGKMPKTMGFSG